jgi:hypothetical protein
LDAGSIAIDTVLVCGHAFPNLRAPCAIRCEPDSERDVVIDSGGNVSVTPIIVRIAVV